MLIINPEIVNRPPECFHQPVYIRVKVKWTYQPKLSWTFWRLWNGALSLSHTLIKECASFPYSFLGKARPNRTENGHECGAEKHVLQSLPLKENVTWLLFKWWCRWKKTDLLMQTLPVGFQQNNCVHHQHQQQTWNGSLSLCRDKKSTHSNREVQQNHLPLRSHWWRTNVNLKIQTWIWRWNLTHTIFSAL